MQKILNHPEAFVDEMLEGILATEEEHAEDMASLLATLDKEMKAR